MSFRSHLEFSVAAALRELSAEDMQRVAEDYARIRFPDRFPRFDFRAFSEEGKSRKGWPDAWIDTGKRVDGVEATAAKDKSDVKKHLADDLVNAKERDPKLSGLVIVCGHPNVQFHSDELAEWHKKFVDEAGIDLDCIDIVCGGGLVEELSRSEFARTRFEVLGLPVSPKHFKLVLSKRGPDERRLGDLIPSDEDYALGRVHRPEIADQVLAKLDRDRCALVRGVGACGKSVLAWLLALEATNQRRPAYILDLAAGYIDASPDTGSALVEDLHHFGHPQALFIVDNCHLAESLAKEVMLAWEELPNNVQPRMLLLGRELHTGRGSLIDGLKIEPLVLKARQAEVRGVYRRLAWRNTGHEIPPEPPPEVLDSWVSTFGGNPQALETTTDLIAFSAAARGQMANLLRQRWTLCEDDAIHEVRSVYLDNLESGEIRNLMQLCVMEELEMSLGERCLFDRQARFRQCNERYGLVFRETMGRSEPLIYYRLAHAALGSLIRRAAYESVNPAATRLDIARRDPNTGSAMLGRLIAVGRPQEAREIADEMHAPTFLLNIELLQRIDLTLHRMQRVGAPLTTALTQALLAQGGREKLAEKALQAPLDYLANFLSYAGKTTALEPVFAALATELASPNNLEILSERALQAPLNLITTFLKYAATTKALKPLHEALTKELAASNNFETLLERALQTPLHFLGSFLKYAAAADALNPLLEALARELAAPNNLKTLIEQALQAPLDHLTNFLKSAATTAALKPLFKALTAELTASNNLKALAEQAPRTPLHFLGYFLKYAATIDALHPLFEALARELTLPNNLRRLVEEALRTPLDNLSHFLNYAAATDALKPLFKALCNEFVQSEFLRRLAQAMERQPLDAVVGILRIDAASDLWSAVFAQINAQAWEEARGLETTPKIDAFTGFLRIASLRKRPELADSIALRLVHESTREDWHQPNIGLNQLTNVLRRASTATPDIIGPFLDRVATPEWIDQQLENAWAGGLAGSIFSLAMVLEPDRRRRFLCEGLSRRVHRELSNMKHYDVNACAQALALLGAAAVLGISIAVSEVDWPDQLMLSKVIEIREPDADRTTIGPLESQLWCGLREMSRLRPDMLRIPATISERILALWLTTESDQGGVAPPLHMRALNTTMITWLQKCKSQDWRLVPP